MALRSLSKDPTHYAQESSQRSVRQLKAESCWRSLRSAHKLKAMNAQCPMPHAPCPISNLIMIVQPNLVSLLLLLPTSITAGGYGQFTPLTPLPIPEVPIQASNFSQAPNSLSCTSGSISEEINAILERHKLERSRLGILVQTLSGKTIYAREHRSYFTPASVTKLLTTAAALIELGENYRFRTSIYGTVDGSRARLRLVGRGDPTLTMEQLEDLAEQLRAIGVTHIEELVAEDGYLGDLEIDTTWEWEDLQEGYGTRVNSLIAFENAIAIELLPQDQGEKLQVIWEDETEARRWRLENKTLTVAPDEEEFVRLTRDPEQRLITVYGALRAGSASETAYVAVPDPAVHFLRYFRRALEKSDIVLGRATVVRRKSGESKEAILEPELAFIESEPLAEIVKETNQTSNNLYSEVLLRLLGIRAIERRLVSAESSSSCTLYYGSPCPPAISGLQAISDSLAKLGVDPEGYMQQDGSGLSRHNSISPEALVQLLRADALVSRQSFRDSLPVAGISGTLRRRLRETSAEEIKVSAKTGGMRGVSTLAGYITSPREETRVFSIMFNNSNQPGEVRSRAIDEIVLLLQKLPDCKNRSAVSE